MKLISKFSATASPAMTAQKFAAAPSYQFEPSKSFQFEPVKTKAVDVNVTPSLEYGDPEFEFDYGSAGNDQARGGDGFWYISTGNGDDYLFAGSNNGDWRGEGNEFVLGATVLDGGSHNDTIQVWANEGAFNITTGEGSDTVLISNDADYVKINAYDSDGMIDTFKFSANFGGVAELHGVDWGWSDRVYFEGGGSWEGGAWQQVAGGVDGNLAFHNVQTGGDVIIYGTDHANLGFQPTWSILEA